MVADADSSKPACPGWASYDAKEKRPPHMKFVKSPSGKNDAFRRCIASSIILLIGVSAGWLLHEVTSSNSQPFKAIVDLAATAVASSEPEMGFALKAAQKSEEVASTPAGGEAPFNYEAHLAELVAEIRQKAPQRVRAKCIRMVRGSKLDSFAQAYQDWVLYHTFYRNMKYGEGFYVDAGANHPEVGSNSFFFDVCLGWKGICVEPNPAYAFAFKKLRSCKLVQNCVAGKEAQLVLSAEKGTKGSVSAGGPGISVLCRPLEAILAEHNVGQVHLGQPRIDMVALDIEGKEHEALRCFPFDAFDIPVWLIETLHLNRRTFEVIMGRAGYWMSPGLMSSRLEPALRAGVLQDNVFVRWQKPVPAGVPANSSRSHSQSLVPALALGPEFLPGRPMENHSFKGSCPKKGPCPDQIPAVDTWYEYKGGKYVDGECPAFGAFKHRLSKI